MRFLLKLLGERHMCSPRAVELVGCMPAAADGHLSFSSREGLLRMKPRQRKTQLRERERVSDLTMLFKALDRSGPRPLLYIFTMDREKESEHRLSTCAVGTDEAQQQPGQRADLQRRTLQEAPQIWATWESSPAGHYRCQDEV